MNEYFNQDLRNEYSWLSKGINTPIINTVVTGG